MRSIVMIVLKFRMGLPSLAIKIKTQLTQRAPDWWESARFQAVFAARGWFQQNGVLSSRPPAGNANR
jgi:hypothetical protein